MKREEQRTKGAMEEIRQALGLPQMLHRVEAYDISNTQGFASVGSMVVFEDGKAKYSDYRKFKIKTVVGPNDFASMQEVITRRLNHAIRGQKQQFHPFTGFDSYGRRQNTSPCSGGNFSRIWYGNSRLWYGKG